MSVAFSLFSLSILVATVSIILLITDLVLNRDKVDSVVNVKRIKSIGVLIGLIYIILFIIRLLFLK